MSISSAIVTLKGFKMNSHKSRIICSIYTAFAWTSRFTKTHWLAIRAVKVLSAFKIGKHGEVIANQ